MSQYPDPNANPNPNPGYYDPNLSYASPDFAASARPGAVTGMAITGIVLGSLGLLCNLFGIAMNGAMLAKGGRNPMAPNTPAMDANLTVFQIVQSVLALAFTAVLLAGSIGALKLKPSAHKTLMAWSVAVLAWVVLTLILQFAWVVPATIEYVKRSQPGNPAMGIMGPSIIFSVIIGAVIYSTMPILFLILWNRPHVKAAFGLGGAMPSSPYQPM